MSSDRVGEGGEAAPGPVEQVVDEARAERDAWRAANWSSVDLADRQDGESWDREPEPLTAEERARLDAGAYPLEAESVDPALTHSERHPRATIVFSDTEVSPDPGHGSWSGEAAAKSTYESAEDVREALLEGKSVPEVRQELAEQQSEPGPDPSSEVVRRQGDLRLERGASQVDADLPGEKTVSETAEGRSQLRRLERLGMSNASDLGDLGKHYVRFGESLLESPKPTGAYTRDAGDRPYVQEAPREALDGGNLTVACIALAVLTREGIRKLRGWVDRLKERRDADH